MLYEQIYIEPTGTVITSARQRYSHPDTGIIYGAGDYDNPAKLAEIGGIELLVAPDEKREGETVHDGNTITVAEVNGRRVATMTRSWRTPTAEESAQERERWITGRLDRIDYESIRALRAKVLDTATKADDDKLAALEAEAVTLRGELTTARATLEAKR